ncbi:MAG: twin-arginine translocase subunit TatC [Candidatus Amulumruptor caecigallinarius]|nr:twin-arginine translocase subunit TatC [Candidatus Amulumruptor caecigallinarius]MCM1395996.1 twin-arginine translocase subunit TatC [Candidatus Amulumruptor caecigallinarius]MCM1454568.1 twin-arginine translocase subunit TatC [bacterium]
MPEQTGSPGSTARSGSPSPADSNADMPFWDHVDQLRQLAVRIICLIAVAAAGMWMALPHIMDSVILAPTHPGFITWRVMARLAALTGAVPEFAIDPTHLSIINIRLASQFFIHASLSFWMAVVALLPALLYMLWGFVAPGLLPSEKRGAGRAFTLGSLMFYLGILTGYFLVFPLTLRFLADYSLSDAIANTLSLDSYMDNFLTLTLVMGIIFELPVVAWMLGRAGLIHRGIFRRYRRHAIVALMLLAAIITPSGDPFTLMAVFLPVYMLWEVSALLVPGKRSPSSAACPNPATSPAS